MSLAWGSDSKSSASCHLGPGGWRGGWERPRGVDCLTEETQLGQSCELQGARWAGARGRALPQGCKRPGSPRDFGVRGAHSCWRTHPYPSSCHQLLSVLGQPGDVGQAARGQWTSSEQRACGPRKSSGGGCGECQSWDRPYCPLISQARTPRPRCGQGHPAARFRPGI